MSSLNPSGRAPVVTPVLGFDTWVVDEQWAWAELNASAIAGQWQHSIAEKPSMFDGRVLVARSADVVDGVFRAAHIVIPYSVLNFWMRTGFPDAGCFNTFGAPLVVSRDGAVLLGVMGHHTAQAGRIYFPCGTPDLDDVLDGNLDIEGSIVRELEEETGLGADHLRPSDSRWICRDGPLICCARRFDTDLTADEIEAVFASHIATETQPELDGVILVKSSAELDPARVPAFALALVQEVLRDQAR